MGQGCCVEISNVTFMSRQDAKTLRFFSFAPQPLRPLRLCVRILIIDQLPGQPKRKISKPSIARFNLTVTIL
jgi:hypothetical protein